MFGLIDHIGVATGDLDASLALYEGTFEMPLAPADGLEQGVEAVLLDVGDCHVELLRPLGPGRRSAGSSSARAPACTTSPTASRTSTQRLQGCAGLGIELIDAEAHRDPPEQVAFLHRKLDRRGPDRDRRTRRGTLRGNWNGF